jgi:hypothetical protein
VYRSRFFTIFSNRKGILLAVNALQKASDRHQRQNGGSTATTRLEKRICGQAFQLVLEQEEIWGKS